MSFKDHFALTGTNAYGGPLSQYQFPEALGNVFFVSHVSGTDSSGKGKTPDSPCASIAYAVSLCDADAANFICALPGHIETLGSAGALALSTAGVTVIGRGRGRQRPRINWSTAAAASLNVTAAGCRLSNFTLTMTGVDAITAGINVTASDFTLDNCEIELASASAQAVLGILATAAATRMRVEDCDFHGTGDAGTTNAIQYAAADDVRIKRCNFHGAYATGSGAIQNTAAALNSIVEDCSINNLTGTCTKAMIFHASTTGFIRRTHMQILSGTAPITGAAMSWAGANYYAATIATGSTLV